ncbi:ATP-binding protein [Krasilnikovia sp. MM14-A1259]|uniref:ATP-binding protein n=1 Tax=Krasilnikovia sp. MM14-A1259 TaxID=3373539 RepID=UPI00382B6CEC
MAPAPHSPIHRAHRDAGYAGTGLDLALCHRIVSHGGTITAADNPGGGSLFTFTLPATGQPGTLAEIAPLALPTTRTPASPIHRPAHPPAASQHRPAEFEPGTRHPPDGAHYRSTVHAQRQQVLLAQIAFRSESR